MTEINGNTVIQMTIKQLLWTVGASAVLLVGGMWAVVALTMGNVRDDVSDIRTVVTSNQDRNAETQQYATSADSELRAQLAELTAELRITNAELSGLNDNIRAVDVRLSKSIERQEAFERSVLIRLGSVGTDRTTYEVPMGWVESQGEILKAISADGDPLASWYRMTTER